MKRPKKVEIEGEDVVDDDDGTEETRRIVCVCVMQHKTELVPNLGSDGVRNGERLDEKEQSK